MWRNFRLIKKKIPALIFDPPSFWHPQPSWNFDYPPVNYDLKTSKRKDADTDSKSITEQVWSSSKKRDILKVNLSSV